MDKKRISVFVVTATLILVLSILCIFYFSFQIRSPEVILPLPAVSDKPNAGNEGEYENPNAVRVEVNKNNVQSVISTLTRANNYHRTISVRYYWAGGGMSVSAYDVYCRNGYMSVMYQRENDTPKRTISGGGKVYTWYEGSSEYYEMNAGEFTGDDILSIPTYEDAVNIEKSRITDAGYIELDGDYCIFVEYGEDALGYIERFWVSVDSGLLKRAETLKNGVKIYEMKSSPVDIMTPTDEPFKLPDGTVIQTG